jgi:hypothetical protein
MVDIEMYALIGLLLRNFVNKWFKNMTDDGEFVNQLINVIAQLSREIERRLKQFDVARLLLDDVPLLLDVHLLGYRKVTRELGSSFLQFDTIDSAFDHVCPHRALQDENSELYLKVLARNVLEKLLPRDESRSRLATKFLNALMGDLLFETIADKLSQPYEIFEIITMACQVLLQEDEPKEEQQSNFDKVQCFISKIGHLIAYSTSINISKRATSLRHVSSFHISHFLNNFFMINTFRPILYATLKALSPILQTDRMNHILSNLIQNRLVIPLKSEQFIARIFKTARNNLFPADEDMGPPRIEPTLEEFEVIRQTAKDNLKKVCQKFPLFTFLLIAAKETELDDVLDDFLTSLEHKRINEHLILRLLDLIVIRSIPELSSQVP